MKKQRIRLWAVILWLLVWQIASMAVGRDILLVSPVKVILRLAELAVTADFWRSILFSLQRIGAGFLLATVLGTILAIAAHRFCVVRDFLSPAMSAIKGLSQHKISPGSWLTQCCSRNDDLPGSPGRGAGREAD